MDALVYKLVVWSQTGGKENTNTGILPLRSKSLCFSESVS